MDGGRRDRANLWGTPNGRANLWGKPTGYRRLTGYRRSRPYGIEELPLYPESLDPPLYKLLILATLEPFVDSFLLFLISIQECHQLSVLLHLPSIPISSYLLWLLQISVQLLL
jgi:hypothetical protein